MTRWMPVLLPIVALAAGCATMLKPAEERDDETELAELLVRFEGEVPGEPAADETEIELPQDEEE